MDPAILSKLRDWQKPAAEHLLSVLQRHGSAVDCSDTGVGKTYTAVAVAASLRLPTLVVVPKISVTAWHRVAEYFGDEFSVVGYEKLRSGNTQFGSWENQEAIGGGRDIFFVCCCCQQKVDMENYSPCYAHPRGWHCVETKKTKLKYGRFVFHPGVKFLVWDEAHRLGGINSLNAEMCIGATRQKIKQLFLSATLGCDPLKFRALGFALGLHSL
jgi:superfamily II DNA or RNA helicase